jgi:hypothetical protein
MEVQVMCTQGRAKHRNVRMSTAADTADSVHMMYACRETAECDCTSVMHYI